MSKTDHWGLEFEYDYEFDIFPVESEKICEHLYKRNANFLILSSSFFLCTLSLLIYRTDFRSIKNRERKVENIKNDVLSSAEKMLNDSENMLEALRFWMGNDPTDENEKNFNIVKEEEMLEDSPYNLAYKIEELEFYYKRWSNEPIYFEQLQPFMKNALEKMKMEISHLKKLAEDAIKSQDIAYICKILQIGHRFCLPIQTLNQIENHLNKVKQNIRIFKEDLNRIVKKINETEKENNNVHCLDKKNLQIKLCQMKEMKWDDCKEFVKAMEVIDSINKKEENNLIYSIKGCYLKTAKTLATISNRLNQNDFKQTNKFLAIENIDSLDLVIQDGTAKNEVSIMFEDLDALSLASVNSMVINVNQKLENVLREMKHKHELEWTTAFQEAKIGIRESTKEMKLEQHWEQQRNDLLEKLKREEERRNKEILDEKIKEIKRKKCEYIKNLKKWEKSIAQSFGCFCTAASSIIAFSAYSNRVDYPIIRNAVAFGSSYAQKISLSGILAQLFGSGIKFVLRGFFSATVILCLKYLPPDFNFVVPMSLVILGYYVFTAEFIPLALLSTISLILLPMIISKIILLMVGRLRSLSFRKVIGICLHICSIACAVACGLRAGCERNDDACGKKVWQHLLMKVIEFVENL